MLRKYFQISFLFLAVIFCYEGFCLQDINVAGLMESIKEDIFGIYTGLAILQRNLTNASVSPEEIKYLLYTKGYPDTPITVDPSNPTELNSQQVPIVFIINGWIQDIDSPMHQALRSAFFAKSDQYYIVSVDWTKYSNQEYFSASYATEEVGAIAGKFIAKLTQEYSIPPSNILLIGFSLGAHVAGFAGKTFKGSTSQTLPRIVALDAAGLLFENRPENERLNKDDAEVVHAIHTSGGSFGFLSSLGSIDFYPNGGIWQNGCSKLTLTSPQDVKNFVFCSHIRSWQYFCEGLLDSGKFQSQKCGSYMSYKSVPSSCSDQETLGNINTIKIGNFYLDTNSASPYSK